MIKLTMIVDSPHGFTAIVEDGDKQLDRREYADGVNCSYDKAKTDVDKPYVSDALQAVIRRYEVQDTEVQVWNKTEAANNFEKMFCKNLTMNTRYPENTLPSLRDEGLKEEREKLFGMSDKELCEAVNAHFGSHPVQTGQKEWKTWAAEALKTEGETSLSDYQRDVMVQQFGYARIQETRIKMPNPVYDPVPLESKAASLEREVFARKIADGHDVTDVYKVDGMLQKAWDGSVSVMGQCSDGNTVCLGKLHDNFLHNNPMNVDSCGAKIEITDFSNQKMKNLRMRVVVNSDEMSGNIVELNNDMLDGLEQDNGLNR